MKQIIAIIGGGTAGLILAAFLDSEKYEITIYDQKKKAGRKFLVAGDGGFNLTHSEAVDQMKSRYQPQGFLDVAIDYFTNEDFRTWLSAIGISTYVGSSGRVFPVKGIKPIEVLNEIEQQLIAKAVNFEFGKKMVSWNGKKAIGFEDGTEITPDILVFALGGGSWKVTGSDGIWATIFDRNNINTIPFVASNCAFGIEWKAAFKTEYEGIPLKNIAVAHGPHYQKGELVITEFGLEGNAIYALSPFIQRDLNDKQAATIYLDLKPQLLQEAIENKISSSKYKTTEALKRDLKLSNAQVQLLKTNTRRDIFLDNHQLSIAIKQLPLTVLASAPLDEAISTSGGLDLNELTPEYELVKSPSCYAIGEMLDWDAPTGGYLIQACVSMGAYLAEQLNKLSS